MKRVLHCLGLVVGLVVFGTAEFLGIPKRVIDRLRSRRGQGYASIIIDDD